MTSNTTPIIPNKFQKRKKNSHFFTAEMKHLTGTLDAVSLDGFLKRQWRMNEHMKSVLHIRRILEVKIDWNTGKTEDYDQWY